MGLGLDVVERLTANESKVLNTSACQLQDPARFPKS